MEIKTARDVRMAIAYYDVRMQDFADRIGLKPAYLSGILHGHHRLTEPIRIRVQEVVKEFANDPPERRRTIPESPEGVTPSVRAL